MTKRLLNYSLVSLFYALACLLGWLGYKATEYFQLDQLKLVILISHTVILAGLLFKSYRFLTQNDKVVPVIVSVNPAAQEKLKGHMNKVYGVGSAFLGLFYLLFQAETFNYLSGLFHGAGYAYIFISTSVSYLLHWATVLYARYDWAS